MERVETRIAHAPGPGDSPAVCRNGDPRDPLRDYYQTLLQRLAWPGDGSSGLLRTLGITSCCRGEGVSTVAAHLAVAAAGGSEHRVLLVDANLGSPSVHRTFAVKRVPGLSELLLDAGQIPAAIQPSWRANLSVVAAGKGGGKRKRACDSADLSDLLEALKADFDLVVFDMAPAGGASFALRLAGLLDGVVLVVEAERVRWEVAQRTRQLLAGANAHLLGAVLNKRRQHVPNLLYRT